MITNISGTTQYVKHNERICQGELFKDEICILEEISEQPERKTDRDGGFGSTGKD
jgi:dUTPase